jgi:hypothetical protein
MLFSPYNMAMAIVVFLPRLNPTAIADMFRFLLSMALLRQPLLIHVTTAGSLQRSSPIV